MSSNFNYNNNNSNKDRCNFNLRINIIKTNNFCLDYRNNSKDTHNHQ